MTVRNIPGSSTRVDGTVKDRGMTLVEVIVAMGIFTAIIAVFMAGIVVMTQNTARSQAVADNGDEVRRVFQRLDKDVRYASAINLPWFGTSGAYYVEYLIDAVDGDEQPLCTQWRYDPAGRVVQRRTWRVVPSPTAGPWVTIATGVRNDLSDPAQYPFKMSVSLKQELMVVLDAGAGASGEGARKGAELRAHFVARNTTSLTATRNDLDANKVSDTPVCQSGGMGRP